MKLLKIIPHQINDDCRVLQSMAAAYQSYTQDHLAAVVKHKTPLSIQLKSQGLVQVNHA